MNDNKGQTIFLSVIGIATLLVAIIGATFAYFTTQMTGDSANINTTTGTVGAATFTAEGISETDENDDPTADSKILPGWTSGDKTVTATLGTSDYDVDYVCNLVVNTNEIEDLYLTVSGDNFVTAANNYKVDKVAKENTETGTAAGTPVTIKIAEGTLKSGETKTMKYALTFAETGTDQNAQQNKTVSAVVSCGLKDTTVYYNAANNGGTTTKPNANIPGGTTAD